MRTLDEVLEQLKTHPFSYPVDCCQFPECGSGARHTHHVTYSPEVTTRLCQKHHKQITIVNVNESHKLGRKLTNRERMVIWCDWVEGLVVARMTPEARRWLKTWKG